MKQVLNDRRIIFVLVCAVLLIPGCGGDGTSGVKVEGRIVRDGKPYAAEEGKMLSLSFASKNDKGEESVYPARINADGSFVVDGPRGKGIPPGTYKLRLNAASRDNDKASLTRLKESNRQLARINSRDCEITSEPNQAITLDLAKGTIGK